MMIDTNDIFVGGDATISSAMGPIKSVETSARDCKIHRDCVQRDWSSPHACTRVLAPLSNQNVYKTEIMDADPTARMRRRMTIELFRFNGRFAVGNKYTDDTNKRVKNVQDAHAIPGDTVFIFQS